MSSTDQRPPEFMRADAARNVQRIVEVAARLIGQDAHAGMDDVARAAEVSRATVYRHFPNREALLEAIRRHVTEQGRQALAACRIDEGSASDALRRLVEAWLELAARYSFPQLAARWQAMAPSDDGLRRRNETFHEPLVALVTRGQAAGELSNALSPAWAAQVFWALLMTGARAISAGELAAEDAPDVVFRTLVDGLGDA